MQHSKKDGPIQQINLPENMEQHPQINSVRFQVLTQHWPLLNDKGLDREKVEDKINELQIASYNIEGLLPNVVTKSIWAKIHNKLVQKLSHFSLSN